MDKEEMLLKWVIAILVTFILGTGMMNTLNMVAHRETQRLVIQECWQRR